MFEFLKKTLLNAAPAAIVSGIGSLILGGDFKQGAKYGAFNAIASDLMGGIGDLITPEETAPAAPTKIPTTATNQTAARTASAAADAQQQTTAPTREMSAVEERVQEQIGASAEPKGFDVAVAGFPELKEQVKQVPKADTRGYFESMSDFLTGESGDRLGSLKQAYFPDMGGDPDYLRRFAPLLGTGIGALYLSGAFDPKEVEVPPQFGGVTGAQLLRENPGAYYLGTSAARRMNQGGYPRKTGAISGPGTETSDDIPAMLSDGEFVMTAKAVRGAGNGSRERGIRNMYDLMNNFEMRV